ncbi:MAG: hypothetical protein LBT06_07490 [Hungatella sp.]|jgi:hypothetical protein|nr:hypothetical protein [Hungatella sp.]
MSYGKEQQKETETIKERSFTLNFSDADIEKVWRKVGCVSLSISELLENFIGDLIDGTYSNGSDERELANQWFERCGFGMFPDKTFLRFLLEQESVDDFVKSYRCLKNSEEQIATEKEDLKNGFMTMRDGSTYTWKDIVTHSSEGEKPSYKSKEEWEENLREDIEAEQEDINYEQEQINEYWNSYLKFADGEAGTLEKEIEKVINWYQEMEQVNHTPLKEVGA